MVSRPISYPGNRIKRCRCGETDPNEFARKRMKGGKLGYQHMCKKCMVAYHKQWRETEGGRAKMRAGVTAHRPVPVSWDFGRESVLPRLTVRFLAGRQRFDRPGWTKPAKGDRPPFGLCLLIWSRT